MQDKNKECHKALKTISAHEHHRNGRPPPSHYPPPLHLPHVVPWRLWHPRWVVRQWWHWCLLRSGCIDKHGCPPAKHELVWGCKLLQERPPRKIIPGKHQKPGIERKMYGFDEHGFIPPVHRLLTSLSSQLCLVLDPNLSGPLAMTLPARAPTSGALTVETLLNTSPGQLESQTTLHMNVLATLT